MAGAEEKEKGEKEEAELKSGSTEFKTVDATKSPIKETKFGKITDSLLKENTGNNCPVEEQKLKSLKQGSTEIHLVKHLMKLKTNPTVKHLTKFVSRLDRVVATIRNLEGVKIMYKLSDEMSEKVKNNIKELEFLSLEMRATLNDLHRLKDKRISIRKEKIAINEKHSSTKREEMQEMETVIGVYDKDLLRSWHIAKKSSSVQTVENFITHLKGKKQATEYACKLATEKLTTLKNRLGRQLKPSKCTTLKAMPPPSSDSDQDSIISTD